MSENSILDQIDFGDFSQTDGPDIGSQAPVGEGPEDPDKKQTVDPDATTVDDSDPDLNVNNILDTKPEEPETPPSKDDDDDEPEDPKDKGNTPDSSNEPESSSSDPFALVYAKYLLESGSISSYDEEALKKVIEEEGEPAALQHLISGEIESAKASLKEGFEGLQKEYMELRELGVSPEDANTILSSIEDVEAISEETVEEPENEDLRRSILTAYYKETTQFSDDRIKKLVDRSFELGDDSGEAKEALSSLKEVRKEYLQRVKEEQKNAAENARKENQKRLEELKTQISDLKEIIPGQKINKQTKDKIQDLLTKPVKQLENGQVLNGIWSKRAENQMDFDMKLAYFIASGLFDGKLDAITRKAKTTAAEELEKHIRQQGDYKGSGNVPSSSRQQSKSAIDSMRGVFN